MTRSAAVAPRPEVATATSRRSTRVSLGSWRLFTGVLMIGAFVFVWGAPIADFDYFWHLADGRFLVATGALPVPDPFSFTAAGQPWVAQEWLAEAAMYLLHRALGDGGPLLLFGLCLAMVALCAMRTMRLLGVRLLAASGWTFLLLLALRGSIGPRPNMAAFALLAIEVWLCERWIARRDWTIWLLPALVCLWINVHGSWPVGLALPALILLGDLLAAGLGWPSAVRLDRATRWRLAGALGFSVVALFFNANGLAGVLYPLTHFSSPLASRVAGNGPTTLTDPLAWPWFALVTAYMAMVAIRRPRLPLADLLIAAVFIVGGLWSWRFTPFAAICLLPLAGRILTQPNHAGLRAPRWLAGVGQALDRWEQRQAVPVAWKSWLNAAILIALLGLALSRGPYDVARAGAQPVAVVDALAAEDVGPIFNQDTWGGYLTWRLWPRQRVFVDDRTVDLYAHGGVLQAYLDVLDRAPNAEATLGRYGIRTVLLQPSQPVVRDLLAGGHWRIVSADRQAIRLERAP